jgi:hypothetical protein
MAFFWNRTILLLIALHQTRGSDAMRDYRAYIFGIDGHRFVWAKDFVTNHPDDAAALEAAKRLNDNHDIEVWEGSRLVARLASSGEGKSPGLIPSSSDCAAEPEPVSLDRVSEVVLASSPESKSLIADKVIV